MDRVKAIVFNQALFAFGTLDSELCAFCKNNVETVLHMFIQYSFSVWFCENVCYWIAVRLK